MDSSGYGNHPILIDGQWSLEDLYKFPRAYEQVYFALDAILPARTGLDDERISRAFQAFPWQGGYSAVNFYNQLKYATPAPRRPRIVSIRYSSPGWIELSLILSQAAAIAYIVKKLADTLDSCNRTYNNIISGLTRRKLLRIEVERAKLKLDKYELYLLAEASRQLSDILSIESPDAVHSRTHNPLISTKKLLSVYRRARILADYQVKGKANLSGREEDRIRRDPEF